MREMEAAMRDTGVMAAAMENDAIRDDAETADVALPTAPVDGDRWDQEDDEVQTDFKKWLTSEDDVVPYNVEVAPSAGLVASYEGHKARGKDRVVHQI